MAEKIWTHEGKETRGWRKLHDEEFQHWYSSQMLLECSIQRGVRCRRKQRDARWIKISDHKI